MHSMVVDPPRLFMQCLSVGVNRILRDCLKSLVRSSSSRVELYTINENQIFEREDIINVNAIKHRKVSQI